MIRVPANWTHISRIAEIVCDVCGAAQQIDLWSAEPLNFAEPTGWTTYQKRGQLYGHKCPVCSGGA